MTSICNSNWNSHRAKLRPPAKRFYFQQVTCKTPFPPKGIPDSLNCVQKRCLFQKEIKDTSPATQKKSVFLPAKLLCFLFISDLKRKDGHVQRSQPPSFLNKQNRHVFIVFLQTNATLENFFLRQNVITLKSQTSHVISKYVPRFPLAPGWLQCSFFACPYKPIIRTLQTN